MKIHHESFEFSRQWVQDLGVTPRDILTMMQMDPLFQTSPEINYLVELGYTPKPMALEHMTWTDSYHVVIEIPDITDEDYTMFLLKFPK